MANQEHLKILRQGVEAWNQWRRENPHIRPDLNDARPDRTDLKGVDLSGADLAFAQFHLVDLSHAKLIGATLFRANLDHADLRHADLSGARLLGTNFARAFLQEANLTAARCGGTVFADIDLSEVKGLETLRHQAPSTVGLDTLYKSGGKIPVEYLRGCGVPEDFITFIPSHFGAQQAIQFYSCFISYSSKDEDFARRLYSRMRDEKLRVWFAPEDLKGGEKLHEQLELAIQVHDRLLIILSGHSMQSEWVMTELRRARKQEIREKRRKLFPIRLASFDEIREWKCSDADSGKDLAIEIREYFIPDFSNWKEHDSFEASFARLLKDLRAAEGS
jgi:hypothetical protein